MDLHNLCFSIWYHNMLQNRVTKIKYIDSTRLLIYLHSFIDTLYHLLIKKKERAEVSPLLKELFGELFSTIYQHILKSCCDTVLTTATVTFKAVQRHEYKK
jgi:hypothetical protein